MLVQEARIYDAAAVDFVRREKAECAKLVENVSRFVQFVCRRA